MPLRFVLFVTFAFLLELFRILRRSRSISPRGSAIIQFLLSFPRQCHFDFYYVSFLLQIFSVFPFLLDLFFVLPWLRPIGPLGSALILFPPSFPRQCHFDLYPLSLSDLNAFSCLPFLFRSFQFSPFLLDLFCIFCTFGSIIKAIKFPNSCTFKSIEKGLLRADNL